MTFKIEDEIHSLAGETLALQTLFTSLCLALLSSNAGLEGHIATAFDISANHIENVAIKFGKVASPKHVVHALRIVEELRANIFGKQIRPGDGVEGGG